MPWPPQGWENSMGDEIQVVKPGDTMYSIPAGIDEASRITTIASSVMAEENSVLTETSKAERLALQRTNKNERNDKVQVNVVVTLIQKTARARVQAGVEVIDNFDAVLGALSYVTASLAVSYWQFGNRLESAIFAGITVVLVIAKHRPAAGWLISLLKSPVDDLRGKIARKYTQTFKKR